MNENEGDVQFELLVIEYDDGTSTDATPSVNMNPTEIVGMNDMSESQLEILDYVNRTAPSVFNYMYNFEAMNIDNEIFYIKQFIDYNSNGYVSPFTNGGDGSKYLQKFKPIQTRNLNSNIITREPQELDSEALSSKQMTIARHVHYLGDVKYGENQFSDRDQQSFSIYIPCMKYAFTEPQSYVTNPSHNAFEYHDDELEGLRERFGGLTSSVDAHINEKMQELATEVFETYISRENIPNIIPNNNRLLGINDLTDEGGSAITITATSTSTSTTY